jgi:hypothetical protein
MEGDCFKVICCKCGKEVDLSCMETNDICAVAVDEDELAVDIECTCGNSFILPNKRGVFDEGS